LTAGLILEKINDVPTAGKSLDQCLVLLRGEVGTQLRLDLVNPEGRQTNKVELTRRKFLVSS
jgi:C-terminal processing protease CtpA/Prc